MPSDSRSAVPHIPSHAPPPIAPASPVATGQSARRSVLAWPAWVRVLAVLPAVALLWLAAAWATEAAAPW